MKNRVLIFDTTLRDGEQVPGCQLNTVEKIEVAEALEDLGVDIIEAGFPISSPGDLKSVQEITKVIKKPVITALARAIKGDIDAAVESLQFAKQKRIHTFISSSDIHIIHQFKSTREKILEQGIEAVKYAKQFTEDVEFSAMDAGRTDNEFLAKFIQAAIQAGATTINIPDTTGYCLPNEFGEKIKYLFHHVQGIENVIVSVHCHNDLGMATANTISAVQNGARQIEVTINGVGERAGNTSLEEAVMILKTRKDLNAETNITTKKIYPTSRLVSRLMRMPVQANKAIVGRNAFAHSSGIHQNGILKNRFTYEIISPKDVGINESSLALTARSGRSALLHHLERLGYKVPFTVIPVLRQRAQDSRVARPESSKSSSRSDQRDSRPFGSELRVEEQAGMTINKVRTVPSQTLDDIYQKFLSLADKKKDITDDDLRVLMGDQANGTGVKLELLEVVCGTPLKPMATVKLFINGKEEFATATGNGPVDSAFQAINQIIKKKVNLEEFLIQAMTSGSDDLGKVHIQLTYKGNVYYGFGADTDIIVASVKAYLDGLNKIA